MTIKIISPLKGYNGRSVFGSATVEFHDGVAQTDEKLPEGLTAYLKGRGYTVETTAEYDGPFDPAKHTVADVRAYLDGLDDSDPDAHDAEVRRIVEFEQGGKNRSTLLESIVGTPDVPATPPISTPPADTQPPTGDQGDGSQGSADEQNGGDDQ